MCVQKRYKQIFSVYSPCGLTAEQGSCQKGGFVRKSTEGIHVLRLGFFPTEHTGGGFQESWQKQEANFCALKRPSDMFQFACLIRLENTLLTSEGAVT